MNFFELNQLGPFVLPLETSSLKSRETLRTTLTFSDAGRQLGGVGGKCLKLEMKEEIRSLDYFDRNSVSVVPEALTCISHQISKCPFFLAVEYNYLLYLLYSYLFL